MGVSVATESFFCDGFVFFCFAFLFRVFGIGFCLCSGVSSFMESLADWWYGVGFCVSGRSGGR